MKVKTLLLCTLTIEGEVIPQADGSLLALPNVRVLTDPTEHFYAIPLSHFTREYQERGVQDLLAAARALMRQSDPLKAAS